MDFIDFNFVLLDATCLPARPARVEQEGSRRERLDLVARQFGEFLRQPAPAGEPPQYFPPTRDFKLRREATAGGAWLSFMVDREGGAVEEFSTEAAYMVFARSDDEPGRKASPARPAGRSEEAAAGPTGGCGAGDSEGAVGHHRMVHESRGGVLRRGRVTGTSRPGGNCLKSSINVRRIAIYCFDGKVHPRCPRRRRAAGVFRPTADGGGVRRGGRGRLLPGAGGVVQRRVAHPPPLGVGAGGGGAGHLRGDGVPDRRDPRQAAVRPGRAARRRPPGAGSGILIRGLVRLLPVGVFLAALFFTEPAAYFLLCFAAFVLVVCDVPACYITLVRTARTPFDLAAGTKVVSVRPGDAI